MQEIQLSNELILELNQIIVKLNYNSKICDNSDYDKFITKSHCLKRVLPESLNQILNGHDRNVAAFDENMLRIPPEFVKGTAIPHILEKLITSYVGKKGIFHITGKFWYPKNGYMGWHTNNAYPGFRLYCSHAQKAGKSFFRYKNPETKEIITSWDKSGWMGRIFKIDKNKPLWHCVYSETNRISTGCNLEIE